MITIKSGDKLIYHPRHPKLNVEDAILTLEDNAAGSLTFNIYDDNMNYSSIGKLYPMISVMRDGCTIFKGRVIADKRNFYNGKTVEVEGKLAFFSDSCMEPFSFQGSPKELFSMIIENHNARVKPWQQFKVGNVTVQDNNDYIVRSSENIVNTWTALKEKCFKSSLGGHIRIRYEPDGDYVDWLADYMETASQEIRFAENIISLSQNADATETYTAIRPVGAEVNGSRVDISSANDGKTYIINEERAEQYGIIFAPEDESVWEDVTLPENLLWKARDKLYDTMAALSETYEIEAVDLHLTDEKIESLNICEYVRVESKPHGIQGRYLLYKAKIAITSPQQSVYYLGASRRVFSDMDSGSGQKKEAIPKKVSVLENDAGYISEAQTEKLLLNYTKEEDVEKIVITLMAQMGGDKILGKYSFGVREDGNLWVTADVEAENCPFSINEDGHLILVPNEGMNAENYVIDENGHLVYRIGG